MSNELKRQRIKGMVELGGVADEVIPASQCQWRAGIKRRLRQGRTWLKLAALVIGLLPIGHSAWSVIAGG